MENYFLWYENKNRPTSQHNQNQNDLFRFSFQKLDSETSCALKGAVFELNNAKGQTICISTSDSNGMVEFCCLSSGDYQLRERSAPLGFEADEKTYQVKIDHCGNTYLNHLPAYCFRVYNTPISSYCLCVFKLDSQTQAPLCGAVFELREQNSSIQVQTTDICGKAIFSSIKAGSYILAETIAPMGYHPVSIEYPILVTKEGIYINGEKTNTLMIKNTAIRYHVIFRTIDDTVNEPVPMAKFILFQQNEFEKTAVSNENGLVDFGFIPTGAYYLKQISSSSGYLPHSIEHFVEVDSYGVVTIDAKPVSEFRIKNRKTLSFTIQKISAAQQPLSGAQFQIQKDGVLEQTVTTDNSGKAIFSFLDIGNYTITESKPPVRYQSNLTEYQLVVLPNGLVEMDGAVTDQLIVTNTPISYFLEFTKKSSNNDFLSGAEFELIQNSTVIATALSNQYGIVAFTLPESGDYIVRESEAPYGYLINPKSFPVYAAPDGEVTIDSISPMEFIVYNYPLPTLRIFKHNPNNIGLNGAQLYLKDETNPPIIQVTDANGIAEFTQLHFGYYQLTETIAPTNYKPDFGVYQVFVDGNGIIFLDGVSGTEFPLLNMPLQFDLSGQKIWEDNNDIHQIRPHFITILLYQNGVMIDQTQIDAFLDNTFTFYSLPVFDSEGIAYQYTIDEQNPPVGYRKTIDNHTIINTLTQFRIIIQSIDMDTGILLDVEEKSIYYNDSFTAHAKNIPGYCLISISSVAFDTVTEDMVHQFEYQKNAPVSTQK